jgi:hypothetical protein
MDIILHVGAHRTGTTAFQQYLRANERWLAAHGTGVWGPLRTRNGLFDGLLSGTATPHDQERSRRASGRIRLAVERGRHQGLDRLIVTEENMIGSVRANLRAIRLYPDAGTRLARHADAVGEVATVALTIRSLDDYWASALAFAVARGAPAANADTLDRLVSQPRSWREVIGDIAAALPRAQLVVLPFERTVGRADWLLAAMTGLGRVPHHKGAVRANARPALDELHRVLADRGDPAANLGGRDFWEPFDAAQRAALRETYLDDLFWLHSGADGKARLIEEDRADTDGHAPGPDGRMTRGLGNDRQDLRMVQTR